MWWSKKKKTIEPDYYISFYSKDGQLGLNYCFDDNNVENFINLFVAVTTGVLAAPTYEQIISDLLERGEKEMADMLTKISKEKFDAVIRMHDEDENDPVVSPLDVFRSNE